MTIIINCKCGRKFQAKDESEGKSANCPACGQSLVITNSTPADSVPVVSDDSHKKASVTESTFKRMWIWSLIAMGIAALTLIVFHTQNVLVEVRIQEFNRRVVGFSQFERERHEAERERLSSLKKWSLPPALGLLFSIVCIGGGITSVWAWKKVITIRCQATQKTLLGLSKRGMVKELCPKCKGAGTKGATDWDCPNCLGRGYV